MSWKEWFCRGPKDSSESDLKSRLNKLEEQMNLYGEKINLLVERTHLDCPPTIVIHQVEKIVVEKLDHSNHFDTIEIKELGGRLNIGANYTGYLPNPNLSACDKEGIPQKEASGQNEMPRYHLRPKKEL